MLKAATSVDIMTLISSRPALGYAPSIDYLKMLQKSLLSVKPNGMNNLVQLMCGTCSNENAMKLAFMWYMVSNVLHSFSIFFVLILEK